MRITGRRASIALRRAARWVAFLLGTIELARVSLAACGGRSLLWAYNQMDEARFTSMAMLTGTLRFRNGIFGMGNDDQVYNGAAYTNWGFGDPLLQMPFQALARRWPSAFPTGFFPDRAIFVAYVACLAPMLWWSFDRLLAGDRPLAPEGSWAWARRAACSYAATLLVLTYALYPLTAYRFFLYEETIAYFVVVQLAAIAAFVFMLRSRRLLPAVALGMAAGVGLLIRPTGVGYLGVWLALVVLVRRDRRSFAAFAAAASPLVAFWLYSNRVRSGSPLSLGFQNSVPYFNYHHPMLRWGSLCSDTLDHASQAASTLFAELFLGTKETVTPYLTECHYSLEIQDSSRFGVDPFFGAGVLALLAFVLVCLIVRVVRGRGDLAAFVPFAALACLFATYVSGGIGIAWRYAGDFWPLVVLVGVQVAARLSPGGLRLLGWRAALALALLAYGGWKLHVTSVLHTLKTLDPPGVAALQTRFMTARWGVDPLLPSRIACRDALPEPYHGGMGWASSCAVDTFTQVYVGVPKKDGTSYELRLETQDLASPSVRVYVNGRNYTAVRMGEVYSATVNIDYDALTAPTVMVMVEWTKAFTPPSGRLLSIALM